MREEDCEEIERSLKDVQMVLTIELASKDRCDASPNENSEHHCNRSGYCSPTEKIQCSSINNESCNLKKERNMHATVCADVDFLAIFAEYDLLEFAPRSTNEKKTPLQPEKFTRVFESHRDFDSSTRSRPNRPMTLSRPGHVLPMCCNFKRLPWRMYVHGDFSYDSKLTCYDANEDSYKDDLMEIFNELEAETLRNDRMHRRRHDEEAASVATSGSRKTTILSTDFVQKSSSKDSRNVNVLSKRAYVHDCCAIDNKEEKSENKSGLISAENTYVQLRRHSLQTFLSDLHKKNSTVCESCNTTSTNIKCQVIKDRTDKVESSSIKPYRVIPSAFPYLQPQNHAFTKSSEVGRNYKYNNAPELCSINGFSSTEAQTNHKLNGYNRNEDSGERQPLPVLMRNVSSVTLNTTPVRKRLRSRRSRNRSLQRFDDQNLNSDQIVRRSRTLSPLTPDRTLLGRTSRGTQTSEETEESVVQPNSLYDVNRNLDLVDRKSSSAAVDEDNTLRRNILMGCWKSAAQQSSKHYQRRLRRANLNSGGKLKRPSHPLLPAIVEHDLDVPDMVLCPAQSLINHTHNTLSLAHPNCLRVGNKSRVDPTAESGEELYKDCTGIDCQTVVEETCNGKRATDGISDSVVSLLDRMHKKYYPQQYIKHQNNQEVCPSIRPEDICRLWNNFSYNKHYCYGSRQTNSHSESPDRQMTTLTLTERRLVNTLANCKIPTTKIDITKVSNDARFQEGTIKKSSPGSVPEISPSSSNESNSTSTDSLGVVTVSPDSLDVESSSPDSLGITETSGISSDVSSDVSPLSPRGNSCRAKNLNKHGIIEEDRDVHIQRTELKLVAGCRWLLAAGFPQYVQMYRDDQFPISPACVAVDHAFLDKDCLQALKQKLNSLNKLAEMNIHLPRKLGTNLSLDDYSNAEMCTLSGRWSFDQLSEKWLRKAHDTVELTDDISEPQALPPVHPLEPYTNASRTSLDVKNTSTDSSFEQNDSTVREKISIGDGTNLVEDGHSKCVSISLKNEKQSDSNLLRVIGRRRSEFSSNDSCDATHSDSHSTEFNVLSRPSVQDGHSSTLVTDDSTLQLATSGYASEASQLSPVSLRSGSSTSTNDDSEKQSNSSPTSLPRSPPIPRDRSVICEDSENGSGYNSSVERLSESVAVQPLLITNHGKENNHNHLVETTDNSNSTTNASQLNGIQLNRTESNFLQLKSSQPNSVQLSNAQLNCAQLSNLQPDREQLNVSQMSPSTASGEEANMTNKNDVDFESTMSPSSVTTKAELRRYSFYDNMTASELDAITPDVQSELDKILNDLYYNIDSLDDSLTDLSDPQKSANKKISTSSAIDNSSILRRVLESTSTESAYSSVSRVKNSTPKSNPVNSSPPTRTKPETLILNGNGQSTVRSVPANGKVATLSDNTFLSPLSQEKKREAMHLPSSPLQINSLFDASLWNKCVATPTDCSGRMPFSYLYAKQLTLLRKLSVLKLTALLDKYSTCSEISSFMLSGIQLNSISTKISNDEMDTKVFGVSLQNLLERDGTPIPQVVLLAIRYLRNSAMDAVGLFRKSGINSQILKLQQQMDLGTFDEDSLDLYGVADVLKRYFRKLPESLLTKSLSPLFQKIFIHIPEDHILDATQRAVVLLPDANRHVLLILLTFLNEIAQHSSQNQMTASNLAVCFLTSFFNPPTVDPASTVPVVGSDGAALPSGKRSVGSDGGGGVTMGGSKTSEVWDYKAALACVTFLISHVQKIFSITDESSQTLMTSLDSPRPDPKTILSSYSRDDSTNILTINSYIQFCLEMTIKDQKDWIPRTSLDPLVELSSKDIIDSECLPMWRCATDVKAPPIEVLTRLCYERHLWNANVIACHVVERLHTNADVFHSVINIPGTGDIETNETSVEFCEFRSWRSDLPRGACAYVSTSTENPSVHPACTARGVVLESHVLIEPRGTGVSRLVYVSRIDVRGHTFDWYTSSYGRMMVNEITRLRESFRPASELTNGPETKV